MKKTHLIRNPFTALPKRFNTDIDESMSEYIPSNESENSFSEEECLQKNNSSQKEKNNSEENYTFDLIKNINRFEENFETRENEVNKQDFEEPGSECNITVIGTNGSLNKKKYCPYCYNSYSKLPRHMESAHSDEKEVYSIMNSHSSEEKKLREKTLYKIKNLGNHIHNIKVLREKKGSLVVVYRPPENAKVDPYKYLPCSSCYGYFSRKDLWKHKCPLKMDRKKKERVVALGRSLLPAPIGIDFNVRHMLAAMRQVLSQMLFELTKRYWNI